MLKEIMKNTIEYVNSFPKKERKSYGQFFTPIQTAEYMASLIRTESEKTRSRCREWSVDSSSGRAFNCTRNSTGNFCSII